MRIRAFFALIAVFGMAGCVSFPKAAPLSLPQETLVGTTDKVVSLPACEVDCPEAAARSCRERLNALYNGLVATELFREVTIGEEPKRAGDFVVDLHDFPRRPYWATPAHNPAFALLSAAIPFWWHEPLGFHFSIRELPDGEAHVVDTRWGGTMVVWSLASLINVFPGRTFDSAIAQGVERLRLALTGE